MLLKLQIRSDGFNICEADAPTERKVPNTAVWEISIKRNQIYSSFQSRYKQQFIVDFGFMIYVCNFDVSE